MGIILTIVVVLLCLILFISLHKVKNRAICSKNKANDLNEDFLSKEKIDNIKEKFIKTQDINIKVNEVSKEDIEDFYKSQL